MARLLTNCRLFTATGPDVVDDAVVAVAADGTISYAGPAEGRPRSTGGGGAGRDVIEEVDCGGRFVMPGLVDCHVHLCHDGVVDVVAEVADPEAVATVKALVNAQKALRAGVTTVRDLGARGHMVIGLAEAFRKGVVVGPRIVAAGRLLTMTGGHGHFLGLEVDGPDAMRQAVRREIKAGATVIKTVATGGVLTPRISAQQQAYSIPELEAAVEAAHFARVPVASHAMGTSGIRAALQAGVDSIEHGCFLDDECLELMVDQGVTLVATLSAPAAILAGADQGIPRYAVDKSSEVYDAHRASFGRAVAAGVPIACGTDAGTPLNPHGSTAGEVVLMVENGLPPADALMAATRRGAKLLRVDGDTGTLVAGKTADVLVVDGDPLTDINAVRRPWLVLRAGEPVP